MLVSSMATIFYVVVCLQAHGTQFHSIYGIYDTVIEADRVCNSMNQYEACCDTENDVSQFEYCVEKGRYNQPHL